MTGEHLAAQARCVVVGLDADGKSTVVRDEATTTRLAGPGNTKCDIWRVDNLPVPRGAFDGLDGRVITSPPDQGLVYRITTFPPDAEWDRSLGYADANGQLRGSVPADAAGGIQGVHATDTLDILTVVSGEMYVVLETGETRLGQGDTLVMRGAKHAWSNRTDRPVTVVSLMMSAEQMSTDSMREWTLSMADLSRTR